MSDFAGRLGCAGFFWGGLFVRVDSSSMQAGSSVGLLQVLGFIWGNGRRRYGSRDRETVDTCQKPQWKLCQLT